jgi:hypothetical protein
MIAHVQHRLLQSTPLDKEKLSGNSTSSTRVSDWVLLLASNHTAYVDWFRVCRLEDWAFVDELFRMNYPRFNETVRIAHLLQTYASRW